MLDGLTVAFNVESPDRQKNIFNDKIQLNYSTMKIAEKWKHPQNASQHRLCVQRGCAHSDLPPH